MRLKPPASNLKRHILSSISVLAIASSVSYGQSESDYPIKSVPFTSVRLEDAFWRPRIEINSSATVPHTLEQCAITGRLDNFAKAAGTKEGHFEGWWFNDSDVYKSIEGAALSLMVHSDPALEKKLDEIIAGIAAAQEPDGYLYTPRKTAAPDYRYASYIGTGRWAKLESSHELYDLGHLYEAAVAYKRATGKESLLKVALKSADLLVSLFGPDKMKHVPGHQEIEIGLTKLYRLTGKESYARLAKFFLDQRGHPDGRTSYGEYSQDHRPVIDQDSAVGHAVRALYMYSGMTEMVALFGDKAYERALDKLWNDVVERKIYVTGGIGAAGGHEGFSYAFELPNLVAYCETCASIANVLWNQRMFQLHGDGKYIDIMERTLYNAMLSGIGMDGRLFFYSNPLESDGRYARSPWFAVACCPPNIARILPQVGSMVYASTDDRVYVNLFVEGEGTIPVGKRTVTVRQKTQYPWDGKDVITIDPPQESEFTVSVRIPGWANNEAIPGGLYRFMDSSLEKPTVRVNGKAVTLSIQNGYVNLKRSWKKGDVVELVLPMPVRRVVARDEVKDDNGRVSLQRGPLVYCIEWPDVLDGHVASMVLPDSAKLRASEHRDLVGGLIALDGTAVSLRCSDGGGVESKRMEFTAIPYYAWAHRGKGEMEVWLARSSSVARPVPCPTIASSAKASSSGGDANALNDQREPVSSTDRSNRYLHWWPKKGTSEWVQYDFDQPTSVSRAEIYWYDDTGIGECKVPQSWQLFYKDGSDWKPVAGSSGFGIEKDRYNVTTFKAVRTTGLRIVVQLPVEFSTGIHEWRVQ